MTATNPAFTPNEDNKLKSVKDWFRPATHFQEEEAQPIPSLGLPARTMLVFYPRPPVTYWRSRT